MTDQDPPHTSDAAPVASAAVTPPTASREVRASPSTGESPYTATAQDHAGPEPLAVRVELVVVGGPAGKELLHGQAIVVRQALQWFADHQLNDCQERQAQAPNQPDRLAIEPASPHTETDHPHDDP